MVITKNLFNFIVQLKNAREMKITYTLTIIGCFWLFISCGLKKEKTTKFSINENRINEHNLVDSLFIEKLHNKGLFTYEKNKKIGFKDKIGKIIVEAKYDIVPGVINYGWHAYGTQPREFLDANTLLVGIKNEQKSTSSIENDTTSLSLEYTDFLFGLIDLSGKELIEPSFGIIQHPELIYSEPCSFYENGLLGVFYPNKMPNSILFLNANGTFYDFSDYNAARSIDGNLIRVEKDGKYGVASKTGEVKIPIIYDGIQLSFCTKPNESKLIQVCTDCRQINTEELCGSGDWVQDKFVKGKHGLVDENGTFEIPLKYESIVCLKNIAFLNDGGEIRLHYDCDELFGGSWEMYDPTTGVHSKTDYKTFYVLNSDLTAVNSMEQHEIDSLGNDNESTEGKWGIINNSGIELLPLKYSSVYLDEEGKVVATIGGDQEIYIWSGNKLKKL